MGIADCITLHCSLTNQTEKMINEDRLKLLKSYQDPDTKHKEASTDQESHSDKSKNRPVFLINTSHPRLVSESSVVSALRSEALGVYITDVHDHTRFPKQRKSSKKGGGGSSSSDPVPNLITLPRCSWYTAEGFKSMRENATVR